MTTEEFAETIRAGAALLSRRRRLRQPMNDRRAVEKYVRQALSEHPQPLPLLEDGEPYLTLSEWAKVLRAYTGLRYTARRLKVIAGQGGWATGFDRVLVGPVDGPWAATMLAKYGTRPRIVMRAALIEPSCLDAAIAGNIITKVHRHHALSELILQYVRERGGQGLSYRELMSYFGVHYKLLKREIDWLQQRGAIKSIRQTCHGFVAEVSGDLPIDQERDQERGKNRPTLAWKESADSSVERIG